MLNALEPKIDREIKRYYQLQISSQFQCLAYQFFFESSIQMNIEKEILDNVFIFIKSKPITPNESEDECLRVYKLTPYVYGTLKFPKLG